MAEDRKRFTVEPAAIKGYGIGTHAIRYTPAAMKNPDGSTSVGLSFQCLIAGDLLANPEGVLEKIAEVLNASDIGK